MRQNTILLAASRRIYHYAIVNYIYRESMFLLDAQEDRGRQYLTLFIFHIGDDLYSLAD